MKRFLRLTARAQTDDAASRTPDQRRHRRPIPRLRHPRALAGVLTLGGAAFYLLFESPFDEQARVGSGDGEILENFHLTNWSSSPISIGICCSSHGVLLDETLPPLPSDGEPWELQTYIKGLADGDCVHTLTIRFQDGPAYRSSLDLCASRFVIVRRNRQVLYEPTHDAFVNTEYLSEWTGPVRAQAAQHR